MNSLIKERFSTESRSRWAFVRGKRTSRARFSVFTYFSCIETFLYILMIKLHILKKAQQKLSVYVPYIRTYNTGLTPCCKKYYSQNI